MLAVLLVVELPGVLPKCIFDEVQAEARVVRAAPGEPRPGARVAPASPQPIRIQTWIPVEGDGLSEAEKEKLEAAVEQAVRMVSSLLSVNRAPGPLLLSRDVGKYCKFLWKDSRTANYNRCGRANTNYRSETCLDVTIPDDHLAGCDVYPEAGSPRRTRLRPEGAGLPDTDFLLYLHVQATDRCRAEPHLLAYAVHCQTDTYGRPLAGVVVLCRGRRAAAPDSQRATVQTVIHELFHALGFSKELFHTWRDCSSTPQAAAGCSPRGGVTHADASGQMRIYTPSVISALQRHLGSTHPELGAPLENLDVPPGRVSSHWESRVLQGSIMAAVLGDWTTVRIDPVTLAALQDTGWYAVDLSRAQNLVWGDGEGAMFGSLSACLNKSSSFFCTGSGFGCHYLHLHKGECQTDAHLEGCRVYKPLKNGSECWKEENGGEEDWSGEVFGFHSRCFFSNLTRQNRSPVPSLRSSVEGRCYRHRCTGLNRYQIQVSGCEWVDCPAGGAIQMKGHRGSVRCPDRRLCLHADVAPPPGDVGPLPASLTSGTLPPAQSGTRPALRCPAASVLGVAAALCLLAAAAATYRSRGLCRTRVHVTPQEHTDL
ncbi:ciliated left-right organizer metallopeptidase [Pseudoliparis swirei]|uniref:ciliated left-right organizer metallopeptidase n=1 Tax=Pseudoliparis swirei TaxID=2059687 RepID=UPI0024BE4D55|nr:ciliated left-right organizer metallopeptidase [Pseudoliparis swirei]